MTARRRPIAALLSLIFAPMVAADPLPEGSPAAAGMDPARLARVTQAVRQAVDAGQVPGAVLLVGRRGTIVLAEAYGARSLAPEREAMTRDTRFDLASLTKPIATATSVMILVERGLIRLDDPITKHLPEFNSHGKSRITVEQLLRHRGGLIADNPIADYADGADAAWTKLAAIDLVARPGEAFLYSDVGFEILGRIVEKVSGHPLDQFAAREVFAPLGMDATGFRPEQPATIAPTEPYEGKMLRGIVHDPRARALGGAAGHAGLFATADDVALYAQMLLDGGRRGDRPILSPLTVRAMIDPADTPPKQRRGLGWDVDTSFSAPRGELFGPRSFGHTGFTGTSLWIDPATQTFVVLLTSRLHPDGKGASPTELRRRVATLTAAAILDPPPASPPTAPEPRPVPAVAWGSVRCGIDVLADREFAMLKGRRVGLITNHTGRSRDGRSTIDVLATAPGVTLVALYSPEHGIRGLVDREIGDDRDEKTGLPIFSLYGKSRKPSPESLEGVEVLVYDIQDIGARFYTYISTMGLAMEAATAAKIPFVILDRPNPIGGEAFDGPVRDDGFESFIAHHPIPVRHGMTVGELGRMFNAERGIGADLTVVPCEGWRRGDLYDATGLLWVNPSPNMRSLTQALIYPGVGLLEATNLATGRGTDTPFERVGAPYIDPVPFAKALNELGIAGLRALPIWFKPTERQFAGEECGGVYLEIVDRAAFEPIELGIGLAVTLRRLYRDTWKPEGLERFITDRATYEAIVAGKRPAAIRALWVEELADFATRRSRVLLYR